MTKAKKPILDDLVVNMVDVGEESGELDTMLYKVADTYDEEVAGADRKLDELDGTDFDYFPWWCSWLHCCGPLPAAYQTYSGTVMTRSTRQTTWCVGRHQQRLRVMGSHTTGVDPTQWFHTC